MISIPPPLKKKTQKTKTYLMSPYIITLTRFCLKITSVDYIQLLLFVLFFAVHCYVRAKYLHAQDMICMSSEIVAEDKYILPTIFGDERGGGT